MNKKLYNELSKIGVEKKIRSHQDIVLFGEKTSKVYLVKKGGLILNHINPFTFRERAINFFIPSFHAMASVSHAYIYNEPSKYQLKTFTNTILVEINRQEIQNFIEHSDLSKEFQDYGLKLLIEKNELRANLVSLSSIEMLKYIHSQYPQILQKVPSKYVADFLGITPQWLSKLKHSL
jgi:hypothetical protein